MAKPVVINNWQNGISGNVLTGFYDMRSCDNYSLPGVLKTNYRLYPSSNEYFSGTFTANASTDIITLSGAYVTGHLKPVILSTSAGDLPYPLVEGTYYAIKVTDTTYRLATTYDNALANTYVNITDAGTGTHTLTSVLFKLPKYNIIGYNGEMVFIDSDGKLWDNTSYTGNPVLRFYNNLSSASGNGLCYWKGWYFCFKNNKIDVINRQDGNGFDAWVSNWQTLQCSSSDSSSHKAIVGSDDKIYYIDNKAGGFYNTSYIGTIEEVSGQTFNAATPASYTFNGTALDINNGGSKLSDILEYGKYIVVSAGNRLFFWDRYSPSYLDPVIINDDGVVSAMINYFGVIYCFMSSGNIYSTNGSSVSFVRSFPMYLCVVNGEQLLPVFNNGGLCIRKNKILMNVGNVGNSDSTISGVWSFDPVTSAIVCENRFVIENTSGNEEVVDEENVFTSGSLLTNGERYFAGWKNATPSPDYFTLSYSDGYRHGSDAPYFISNLMGDRDGYNTVQIILASPLTTGSSISVYYRENIDDTWTQLQEMITSDTESSLPEFGNRRHELSFPKTLTQVQIKVVLSSSEEGGVTERNTSPLLIYVIVY